MNAREDHPHPAAAGRRAVSVSWREQPGFVGGESSVSYPEPAAHRSRSHMISVLATPGTVARDYTRELVRTYAAHCDVTLVGSSQLASADRSTR